MKRPILVAATIAIVACAPNVVVTSTPAAPTRSPEIESRIVGIVVGPSLGRLIANGAVYEIVGDLKNSGPTEVKRAKIIATLFDAGGSVIATDYGLAETGSIPAGASSPFKVIFLSPPPAIARYRLQIVAD